MIEMTMTPVQCFTMIPVQYCNTNFPLRRRVWVPLFISSALLDIGD